MKWSRLSLQVNKGGLPLPLLQEETSHTEGAEPRGHMMVLVSKGRSQHECPRAGRDDSRGPLTCYCLFKYIGTTTVHEEEEALRICFQVFREDDQRWKVHLWSTLVLWIWGTLLSMSCNLMLRVLLYFYCMKLRILYSWIVIPRLKMMVQLRTSSRKYAFQNKSRWS